MNLKEYIRIVDNFPVIGVSFKDITPLLASHDAFSFAINTIAKKIGKVDKIAGLDARGFIFGGAIAHVLGIPFIPIRKIGKLPHEVIRAHYQLEYGTNTLEIHTDAIKKGEKIAVIDDLLATGGSAKAAIELVEKLGGIVDSLQFVIELDFLEGRKKLEGYHIDTLVNYE